MSLAASNARGKSTSRVLIPKARVCVADALRLSIADEGRELIIQRPLQERGIAAITGMSLCDAPILDLLAAA